MARTLKKQGEPSRQDNGLNPGKWGVLAAITLALSANVVRAHHSFALYTEAISEVEGELMRVDWRNPHVRLTLRVASEAGDDETWILEGAAGYVLQRRGLLPEFFNPGDRIRAAGRLHSRESSWMWLHNILLGGEQELLMIGGVSPRWDGKVVGGGQEPVIRNAVTQNRGLFRVWSQPVLRPITYGDDLPYRKPRPEGGAEWIERLNGYAERCEPVGMPGVMATPYPFEFIDQGTTIRLLGFSNNAPIDRTINLETGNEILPGRMGYSLGRWENERELVVETGSIEWPYFDDSTGTELGDTAKITEWFELSEDQARLDYRMIVEDPKLFVAPATVIETHWIVLGEDLVWPPECSN